MSNPFDEAGDAAGAGDDGFAELDQHALPFVTVDEQDRFHINPEAVRYLKTITGRVAVVAIAGAVKLADGTRRVTRGHVSCLDSRDLPSSGRPQRRVVPARVVLTDR